MGRITEQALRSTAMKPPAEVQTQGTDIFLHVVGRNVFINGILANFLEEHTGIPCGQINSYADWSGLNHFLDKTNLVVMDYIGLKRLEPPETACIQSVVEKPNHLVVIFNLNPDHKIEYDLLNRGVKGILYKHQPITIYPKAVRTVLSGELWYPRKTLEQHFLSEVIPPFMPNKIWDDLTARQKEILELVTTGRSNQEIAQKLHVSPHTIKTHIYAIYKKLNVRSRLEASLKMTNH
ncbi:MAG: response regulator transcription factor [Desulfatitalea sp.]